MYGLYEIQERKKKSTENIFSSVFRHAALMAISAIGEGCHKQMEALLPQIMDGVIQYLQDPVSMINKLILLMFFFFLFRFCICNIFNYSTNQVSNHI